MKVRLVSLTTSMVAEAPMTPEELIVYIARVSNPSNQLNTGSSVRLLEYLINHKHWSPFEMVDMCVEIVTSRGIAQQILRHRSFSFQEFSQRYAAVTNMEPVQLRRQADSNRQSSTEEFDPYVLIPTGDPDDPYKTSASNAILEHIDRSQDLYKALLESGVAKECARFVLPITTQTKIYMKGSIRSWIHYLQIRADSHTQLEHQQVAQEILYIFRQHFTNIATALKI